MIERMKGGRMVKMHPGIILRHTLEDMEITNRRFAELIKDSESKVSQLLSGNTPISKKMAMKIEKVLDIPAEFWLNLRNNYEGPRDRILEGYDDKQKSEILKDYTEKRIQDRDDYYKLSKLDDKIMELLRFFGVKDIESLSGLYPTLAFRKTNNQTKDNINEKLKTWIRIVQLDTSEQQLSDFSVDALKSVVKQIRDEIDAIDIYTNDHLDINKVNDYLQNKLNPCGVAYLLTDKFENTGVYGYTEYSGDYYTVGQTTLRKYEGQFWFSFFHEIGHIILGHLNEDDIYIDVDHVEAVEKELEADNYSADILIPKGVIEEMRKAPVNHNMISDYAKTINLPAGIIVGRLQHEEMIGYNEFNELKRSF